MPPRNAPWGNSQWKPTPRPQAPRPAGVVASGPIKPAVRAPGPAARQPVASVAQFGAAKRPGPPNSAGGPLAKKPTVAAGVAEGAGKDAPQLVVSTQSKKDEIGIQTLVGDYTDRGTNHGRKYYQKIQKIQGHEDIKVFLYYWDARDGPDFCGWWFGDEIGGSQVWARSNSHGTTPPRVGWKIPWDAPKPEPGILLVDPFTGGTAGRASSSTTSAAASGSVAQASKAVTTSSGAGNAAAAARVQKATEQVEVIEAAVNAAISRSKETADAKADETAIKESQESLSEQQTALLEVQKSLTADISEARKGGVGATSSVTELSKLSPRVRTLQTSLSAELNRVRALAHKAVQAAQNAKRQAETQEQQKKAEEKDTKDLQESLPASIELVTAAEDAVESVALMAAPLIAEPPDNQSDILKMAMDEIEAAATEGVNKILEARKQINVKLQAARKYAPETRKNALSEYSTLQQKLTEAQKKVNPYKSFRKEFQSRVEARKALTEIAEKISDAELEVEKATMTSSAADQGQMSEDEVGAAEEMVKPAQQGISAAMQLVEQKLRGADGAVKDELNELKERGSASRKKLESVVAVLKRQREGLTAQQVTALASEEVSRAENSLAECQEAEMPFLKGLEVLPPDESTNAITQSEAAAAKTDKAINHAKVFIRTKLGEAKRYSKEVAKTVTDELNELMKRAEAAAKKLSQFKQETLDRKMASLLAEVVEGVAGAEKKVAVLTETAQIFWSEELEKVSSEALKEAGERALAAEKEASYACLEARKVVAGKQREAKGPDASAAIKKLNDRLSAAQQELAKQRKAASSGEKLIKGKEVILEEEERVSQAEAHVEKAEETSSPREDLGEERLSDERIAEMVTAIDAAQGMLKASSKTIDTHLPGAVPVLKSALDKFKERIKRAHERLNAVLVKTKDQRERVQCEASVKDATQKVDEVEKALDKVNDAELPFLKGIEVLPLKLATDTIKESEVSAAAAQTAISHARTFIASKNLELKRFAESTSKPAAAEFSKLTERINAAAAKLSAFRKDTEARKKTAQVQETGEKIAAAEAEVQKLLQVVEPLTKESADPLPEETAFELCEQLSTLLKEAQVLLDSARTSLAVWSKDARGSEAHKESMQKMQAQLAKVTADLTKAKKASEAQMKAHVEAREKKEAAAIINELKPKVEAMEDSANKLEEASKPLTTAEPAELEAFPTPLSLMERVEGLLVETAEAVAGTRALVKEQLSKVAKVLKGPLFEAKRELQKMDGRAFALEKVAKATVEAVKGRCAAIVDSTCGRASTALRGEVQKRGLSLDQLFEELRKGEERISEEAFVSHLGTLEGAACKPEHAKLICRRIQTGGIGKRKFLAFLQQYFVVVKSIAMTNEFDVGKAKTLRKAEVDEVIEVLEGPCIDQKLGLTRIRGRSLADSMEGWISVSGNRGTPFLQEMEKPYYSCMEEVRMEKDFKSDGQELIRTLKVDEVLELIEGPRKDSFEPALRVRGKACSDGATGWFTVKDKKGEAFAEVDGKFYACSTSVAMTDTVDIKECKVVRKLAVGELFTLLEGPVEDKDAGVTRVKGKCLKDEQEGWVTTKGNAGTVYAAASSKHYCVVQPMPLQKKFESDSAETVRELAKDEVLQALEGPKEEAFLPELRVKCNALRDGTVGWITLQHENVKPWSHFYKCLTATPIQDARASEGATTVRQLDVDEVAELLEGPVEEGKELWMKTRAEKDGTVGWVMIKDSEGKRLLQS